MDFIPRQEEKMLQQILEAANKKINRNGTQKKKGNHNEHHSHAVLVYDVDESETPASMPLLRISSLDNSIFITVCKETQENNQYIYTIMQDMQFDLHVFLDALSVVVNPTQYQFSYTLDSVDET